MHVKSQTTTYSLMKKLLIQLASFASLLAATSVGAADAGAFPHDQVRGKVRCVLMSVGQTTVFLRGEPQERSRGDSQGVPCLTITYLIERLGNEPFRSKAQKEIEISFGGKPLTLVNFHSGTYTKAFDYERFPDFLDFRKPPVAEPSRAFVIQYVQFGALPNLKPLDVVINAGFDDEVPTFKFLSIKLQ